MYNKLNIESKKIIHPKYISLELKEHQRVALYSMTEMENNGYVKHKELTVNTNIGILADDPGSGKSIMIVSLISNNKKPVINNRIHYGSPFVCLTDNNKENLKEVNLILVPYKLLSQWVSNFNKCNNLKVYSINTKIDLLKLKNINDYDVIICSDIRYKNFYEIYADIKWGRLIIDEVDSIKLPSTISWNAGFIWLITSYPDKLLFNNKNFIRMIFKNITSYVFNFLIVKNDSDFIKLSIDLPKLNKNIIKCLTPKEFLVIKKYVNENIMNMLNAGNITDAIQELNCNVHTEKNIFQILTKNIYNELHNKNLEYDYQTKLILTDDSAKDKIKIIKNDISSLETKLNSLKQKISNINKEYCSICLDKLTMPTISKCCNNMFCFKCIITATNTDAKCPLCRTPVNLNMLHVIDNNTKIKSKEPEKENNNLVGKIENLNKIIKANPNGKYIIFSNYAKTFDKVKDFIQNNDIKYKIINGTEKKIKNMIKSFDQGKLSVLMMNSDITSSGLDLHMVTDLIVYHKLEYEIEESIISRAYRLGRKKPLNVHYLYYETEIDKDITV